MASFFDLLAEETGALGDGGEIPGVEQFLVNQLAANACQRPVVTGPVEATSAGNILMQMLATGAISSLAEGRAVIRRSFDTERFEPQDTAAWDEVYARFVTLL